jgi:hypothetical protein
LSVVFIDGCKSWYSTKALFSAIAGDMVPGGWVVAQDYGRYTTHWIPCFLEAFAQYFEPYASIDDTYIFRYRGGLEGREVAAGFPDAPAGYSANHLDLLFESLYERAARWGDLYASLVFGIQHAGALASAGYKDRASDILGRIVALPAFRPFERVTAAAQIDLTFTPDGPVTLEAGASVVERSANGSSRMDTPCNICGGMHFRPGPGERLTHGMPPCCAECGSLERHRAIRALYGALLPVVRRMRALHLSPDRCVAAGWFASYVTAPQETCRDMAMAGDRFDLIIANHTLHRTADEEGFLQTCFDMLGDSGVLHLCVSSPLYRWSTIVSAAGVGGGPFRDYGADFVLRIASYVDGLSAIAVTVKDPVTQLPDVIGFFSRSATTLQQLALPLERVPVPLVRVA